MRKQYDYENLYALQIDIPGFPAGTLFQHRKRDAKRDLGSEWCGYLTNIYVQGDCQAGNGSHIGWVEGTHVFPGQVKDDREWFIPVELLSSDPDMPKTYEVKGLKFVEVIE